jgi:hypothetical protein
MDSDMMSMNMYNTPPPYYPIIYGLGRIPLAAAMPQEIPLPMCLPQNNYMQSSTQMPYDNYTMQNYSNCQTMVSGMYPAASSSNPQIYSYMNDDLYSHMPPVSYNPSHPEILTYSQLQIPAVQMPVIDDSAESPPYMSAPTELPASQLDPISLRMGAPDTEIPSIPGLNVPGTPFIPSSVLLELEDDYSDEEPLREDKDQVNDIFLKIENTNPAVMKSLMLYNIPYPVARRLVRKVSMLTLKYK